MMELFNRYHCTAVLLGFFDGVGGFDSFGFDGNFFVDGVGVGRWSRSRVVHDFFDDGDLRVLVFITTSSSESAIHNEAQDKDHPEENSNSATWINT